MKIKQLLKGDKKGSFGIYILLLLGVALLVFGAAPKKEKAAPLPQEEVQQQYSAYVSELEGRLAAALSAIDGAGRVQVMLVAENGGSVSVGKDGSGENSKTVVLNKQSGSEALVLAENTPGLRGALIVAEGAGNDRIRAELTEAAATALGVGVHRVKVYKMKRGE